MHALRAALVVASLLAGCVPAARQSSVALPPAARYAVERGDASREDIAAAVLAARRSRYFPGTERCEVDVVGPDQIDVLYYDVPGTMVIVRRVHGRWKAVDHGFGWQT